LFLSSSILEYFPPAFRPIDQSYTVREKRDSHTVTSTATRRNLFSWKSWRVRNTHYFACFKREPTIIINNTIITILLLLRSSTVAILIVSNIIRVTFFFQFFFCFHAVRDYYANALFYDFLAAPPVPLRLFSYFFFADSRDPVLCAIIITIKYYGLFIYIYIAVAAFPYIILLHEWS